MNKRRRTMGKIRIFKILALSLLLGGLSLPAIACVDALGFSRPDCEPSQMQSGVCLNAQMPQAAQLTKSARFQQAFTHQVDAAQAYLDTLSPSPSKVVVADLDETLVNNTEFYRTHRSYRPEVWRQWIHTHRQGPYNMAVLQLLQHAKAKGFSVMFITGRQAEQAHDTLEQISAIPWDGVYFKPMGIPLTSSRFKAQVRQMLQSLGYTIVLNIGDQPSDLDTPAEPAQGQFLLPNVLYSIP